MYTIITKKDCKWCVLAKRILKQQKVPFKELHIPHSLTREEFHTIAEEHNTKPTVPKVFMGKTLIGGYEDLVEHFKENTQLYNTEI